jgi:predicted transcriptional regulator
MKINDLAAALNMKVICPGKEDAEVTCGYTSDLLSDVMANAEEGCALITIQAHVNTVAVSSLAGAAAVIICHGRAVPDDMAEAARREGVAVLQTEHNQFITSHLVHSQLSGTS